MNKNRGFTPLAVVLMLSGSLALTGCDDKQAQQGGQQMPAVGVVTVKTEPLQITTELPGRTSAYRIAEVRPQVSGIILKRNFKEGSDIEAGVSLYQIDSRSFNGSFRRSYRSIRLLRISQSLIVLLFTDVLSTEQFLITIHRQLRESIWLTPKSPLRLVVALVSQT
ncbi:hypothetical protein AWF46_04940 [Escherichia coli]|nr:hypothetical protein AWF49_00285 [Escherichia coli]KUV81986.1 hypothetical protein AWF46_04940 [Escherichia coli]